MTTGSISHLPLALGSVLAAVVGNGLRWCAEQFIRAPLATSGIVLVSGLTLMGGANALFLQENRHPAPIFADRTFEPQVTGPAHVPPRVEPVIHDPVPQQHTGVTEVPVQNAQDQSNPTQTAQQTPADPQRREIVNADIAEMQEKLGAMGHFEGTVDGLYGPKTADAIRAFEEQFGLPRSGAATPEVLEAIKNAPLEGPQGALDTQPVSPTPAARPAEMFDAAHETVQVAEANMGDLGALIASDGDTGALMAAAPQPMPAPIADTAQDAAASIESQASATLTASNQSVPPARDRDLVSEVQRGLIRLGFLQAPVDGVAGETTARAIRQFQIFHNYRPTGEVTLDLLDMLEAAGAYM